MGGDIKAVDLDDLRRGNLLAVRDRYEMRRDSPAKQKLNPDEHALLCDIYVKHVSFDQAFACLSELSAENKLSVEAVTGKRALLQYLLGHHASAAALAQGLDSDGGRYVYALSAIQLGDEGPAVATAQEWELSYAPPRVFLAANLYLAAGRYDKALAALQEPERRLDRDYGLSGGRGVFGQHIAPAPLRIDLFGEFGVGLLDTYSYAPQGNVYVEYTLAKAELELGMTNQARQRYDLILTFPGITAYRDVLWRALADRAKIALSDGYLMEAVKFYERSVSVIESARASVSTDAGRIGFVGDKQDVYGELIQLLVQRGRIEEAFEYSERARSRALVDLLASVSKFGPRRGSNKTEQNAVIRQIERTQIQLSDAQAADTPVEEVDRRTRALTEDGRRAVASLPLEVAALIAVETQEIRETQNALVTDEVLLSYFEFAGTWHLWCLKSGEEAIHFELSGEHLARDVHDFADALKNGTDYKKLGKRLYDRLIAPAKDQIPEGSMLTIVPYGILHYIPFSALILPDNRFLVDAYAITNLPSADVKRFLVKESVPVRRVLAVGNPARRNVKPLAWAEQEAHYAASFHHESKVLSKRQATKPEFLGLASGYDTIHLASHGEFNADDPLQSRILLAESGPKGSAADPDLTVVDLLAIEEEWGASLTVLSACETGLAGLQGGHEIIGLLRGFLYAGTDSVVGSLWKIPDRGTYDLMLSFYSFLDSGHPGPEALRLAQIQVRKTSKHPQDWAAFVYTGLHV